MILTHARRREPQGELATRPSCPPGFATQATSRIRTVHSAKVPGEEVVRNPDSDSRWPGQSSNALAWPENLHSRESSRRPQRAKRRAEEHRRRRRRRTRRALPSMVLRQQLVCKGNQRHSQQQSQQQSQQSAAQPPYCRFKAAHPGTVPAVSPISSRQRKQAEELEIRVTRVLARWRLQLSEPRAAAAAAAAVAAAATSRWQLTLAACLMGFQVIGASGAPASRGAPVDQTNMFAGLSSGSVDTNPRDHATSRESLSLRGGALSGASAS